ncbi:MATE family efflux transporter [Treponema sp.]|uniref:MATE family efflux transporter n=1 Tax=Treponema sp. TaxID=166 RepID=UPI00298EB3B3|nr:MATE family efflux transporter [Treponema sp.]MCQ2240647.1 MATE family efflux transporter [Treponema sp.]
MENKKARNLTSGPLLKQIIIFSLPLIASGMLQQLFNSCDIAVVGRFVGPEALAAVGSTSPLINLVLNIFMGLSVGANVLIATLEGQRKTKFISSAVHTIILLSFICGIFLTFIGIALSGKILVWIETPYEVLDQAALYLKIYFLGIPFILLYNFGAAVLRGRGESFKPAAFLIVAGFLNVVMNLVFVICFGLGAAGVGIATTLSNFFSSVCILVALSREKDEYKFRFKNLLLDRHHCSVIFRIGMPAGIQGIVFSLSNLVIQGALNTLGPKVMAGSASGVTFEIFAYFIVSAFVQCAVTFTSQNYGAGNISRCRKSYLYCMILSVGLTVSCSMLFTLFRFQLSGLYSSDPETISYCAERILKVEIVQFLINSYEITAGALRGLGCSLSPALITIFGTCSLRLLWIATVFPRFQTYESILFVYPVSWIVTGTAMIVAYILYTRKKFNKI